jgi:FdhE protein
MTQKTVVSPDPTAIGEVSAPPFSVLPNPSRLFAVRAARLRALAGANALAPYLKFLAGLAEAQHGIIAQLPELHRPDAEQIARARKFQMPPLDRGRVKADPAMMETFDRFFGCLKEIDMPIPAADALAALQQKVLPNARRWRSTSFRRHCLPRPWPSTSMWRRRCRYILLGSRVSSTLRPWCRLAMVSARSAAGNPQVPWLSAGWAHMGPAFALASCAAIVRIKCVLCNSTEGIGYQEIHGGLGTVKAETCDKCHGWVKILQQQKDPAIEPIADDVASLGLDLLMREGPYRRGGFNPYLAGY